MSGNKKGSTLHPFGELGRVVALIPPPELPEVQLEGLEDLEAQAKKVSEGAAQVRAWTLSTVGQLELARGLSRIAKELAAEKIAAAKEALRNFLNHEVPAYRRAAWLGLLEFELKRELNSRAEVEEVLFRLVQEGRLNEEPAGDLKAFHKTYSVSSDSLFGEPEIKEVRWLLANLLRRVFTQMGKAREEKALALQDRADMSLEDLLKGQPGKCAVEVPPERAVQNGKEFWRGGGVLLVESNGQDIYPLDASGSIEGAIKETRELRINLRLYTLNHDKAPVVPGLDLERGKKIQLFWYLLKRAIRAKAEREAVQRLRQEYADQAKVSPEAFFLEQKPGVCLAEFQGNWQNPDGSAGPSNFFFLIERKEEEGATRIRIVDAPDHLSDFFAKCMDEYTEKGNKFEGIPYPLRAVLMAVYGQVSIAVKSAEKAGQIVNGG